MSRIIGLALKEIDDHLAAIYRRNEVIRSDAIEILTKIRVVLEAKEKSKEISKESFQNLNLFCNWCVHSELEGSMVAYRALKSVSISLADAINPDNDSVKTTDEAMGDLSSFLKLSKLREEIIHFLEINNVNPRLFLSDADSTLKCIAPMPRWQPFFFASASRVSRS